MTMPVLEAWSYSGNPNDSALDAVRFLYQDTDPNVRLLSNNEVNYTIVEWLGTLNESGAWVGGPYDHPLMAAHGCALRVAAKFAGVTSVNADGVTITLGDISGRYTQLAATLKAEYDRIGQTGAVVDLTNLMVGSYNDPSIRPLNFAIGMNDNLEAGQQDMGGMQGNPYGAALSEHL